MTGLGGAPGLDDCPSGLLRAIFSHLDPLPDLFRVAQSCRRFRDLALDRHSWLYVTHAAAATTHDDAAASASPGSAEQQQRRRRSLAPAPSPDGPAATATPEGPHWYRSQFSSLEAALAASRPGDTILLEPGPAPHRVPAMLVVPHPVHILGGGAASGECVVEGARGLEALVDFRASGRLANLTLRATAGACVAHTRGRLTVQSCTLECDARGLPHLAAPLIARAVSCPPQTLPPAGQLLPLPALPGAQPAAAAAAVGAQPAVGSKRRMPAAEQAVPGPKRPRSWLAAGAAAAGAGVLRVVETRIKAQGLAVDLRGSGQLAGVRAIYSTGHALVWLEVDSANAAPSGGTSTSGMAVPAGKAATAAVDAAAAAAAAPSPAAPPPGTPLPSWLGKAAAAGFDAAAFQRRLQQRAALPPDDVQQHVQQQALQAGGAGDMERKAEAWCCLHHTSLAAPLAEAPPVPGGATAQPANE
ncbi:F-box SKIP5 [Micractinium conductrix]|uniref:F-box SKIP5 n=1 Tax=Micractinium conductrix TaxID=554055 RepID=A0A2P6V390_9CHLO|nr:F-box SKIP5 [Micractinium conductrix]|eukprot:PSC68547.1 F-box SKIP5 [Micractinium conductrix]